MNKLTSTARKFIFHWGEMGTRWGVNRTVAQIHALLYLSKAALNARQIGTLLSVAQSNVSSSLKELQGWRLVHKVPTVEKRDYFTTSKDLWKLFQIVSEERKKRELDPTLSMLRDCLIDLKGHRPEEIYTGERIKAMLDFLEQLDRVSEQIRKMPPETFGRLIKLGLKTSSLASLLGMR